MSGGEGQGVAKNKKFGKLIYKKFKLPIAN